jgi:hypothetical protein
MSIAIPIRQPQRPQAVQSQAAPPDPVYALMAATAMHQEGRLLAQDRSGQDAKIASIPVDAQRPLRSL